MNASPLVSVIIPCYNHEQFVKDCIQSVIDQTYENIELIIIDDGSKDCSVEKIKKMIPACNKRFINFEFRSHPNKGLSATLNEAIEWCKGEFISILASDDLFLENKIKIQSDYLIENNNCVACFGGYILIDKDSKELYTLTKNNVSYSFEDIILHKHDLPAPTQMIRLEALKKVEGYSEDIIIEDWYMWLKLSKVGNLDYISQTFSKYRSHENNISKKVEIMNRGRNQILQLFIGEKLYSRAKFKINWIYLAELKNSNFRKFIILMCISVIKHPNLYLCKILKNLHKYKSKFQ